LDGVKGMTTQEKCFAVLRLRGSVNISRERERAFALLHLHRKNHVTLMRDTPSNLGMIRKIKDYATWGEASPKIISQLIQQRGFLKGNQKVTDEAVEERLGYESIKHLGTALHELKADLWRLPDLKPVFRLHPPKGGFHGSIKKPYPKGELGYRGEKINDLLAKMI
jgi:large subunit ribosomal protein L30